MVEQSELVFMLDVDNTLLDNDRSKQQMDVALRAILGPEGADRFWAIYEAARKETGVVDYPLTLQRFGAEYPDAARFAAAAQVVNNFPYQHYVYPQVPAVLAHLQTLGTTAILSDGDPVFQVQKIRVSGLEAAVGGRVLVFDHKDQHLDEIAARYPAARYVMIDDKDDILDRIKAAWGARAVTVHVCQGKYALAPQIPPLPDIEIDHIADLLRFQAADFRPRTGE